MPVITSEQLNEILSKCGYETVGSDVSSEVVGQINEMTDDRDEAAMFVAHLIHESGGFQKKQEVGLGCKKDYGEYYGRGYIQLTGIGSYRAASRYIFKDDRLVVNPNLVLVSPNICMRVSVWFWKEEVRRQAAPFRDFHDTTKVISGGLEPSPDHPQAMKRYKHYLVAAKVLESTKRESEQDLDTTFLAL